MTQKNSRKGFSRPYWFGKSRRMEQPEADSGIRVAELPQTSSNIQTLLDVHSMSSVKGWNFYYRFLYHEDSVPLFGFNEYPTAHDIGRYVPSLNLVVLHPERLERGGKVERTLNLLWDRGVDIMIYTRRGRFNIEVFKIWRWINVIWNQKRNYVAYFQGDWSGNYGKVEIMLDFHNGDDVVCLLQEKTTQQLEEFLSINKT